MIHGNVDAIRDIENALKDIVIDSKMWLPRGSDGMYAVKATIFGNRNKGDDLIEGWISK